MKRATHAHNPAEEERLLTLLADLVDEHHPSAWSIQLLRAVTAAISLEIGPVSTKGVLLELVRR